MLPADNGQCIVISKPPSGEHGVLVSANDSFMALAYAERCHNSHNVFQGAITLENNAYSTPFISNVPGSLVKPALIKDL